MRTSPERFATRQEAEQALWKMADDGRTDCTYDRRFYALLLATFASLRWGEATALRRSGLDLNARTVWIRAAYVERSTRRHGWADTARQLQQAVGLAACRGVHRHAGPALPRPETHRKPVRRQQRCGPARPEARMGTTASGPAMIYQHKARGADRVITSAIDIHVQAEQDNRDDDNGSAGGSRPCAARAACGGQGAIMTSRPAIVHAHPPARASALITATCTMRNRAPEARGQGDC